MNLNEYQERAVRTMTYTEDIDKDELRLVLGVCGESGELAEKYKKALRGDKPIKLTDIILELGDIMWYIAVLADKLDVSLDAVADANIQKLASRQERNVIKGSGDHR